MTESMPNVQGAENLPKVPRFEGLVESGFVTRTIDPSDKELWLKMGQMRGEIYTAKGFIPESALDENGAEFDEFDDFAQHIVALDDEGEMIGTVRVIERKQRGFLLPSEVEFGVTLQEATQEISRFMRRPDLPRRIGPLVSVALMRAALKQTFGVSDNIYAVLEDALHRELGEHIGIGLTTVAEPRFVKKYNTVNHLVEMHPRTITQEIHRRDQERRTPLLGQNLASFFERNSATQGLGRVSLSDLVTPNPDQYERNEGFLNPTEREHLGNVTVAVAGAGGDGGEAVLRLAQAGVRKFRLADPEFFEIPNTNRQFAASFETNGENKAKSVAAEIKKIFPYVEIDVYEDGVDQGNVADFVEGADLVIDETEYTEHAIGAMLAQEARKQGKTVLMGLNVGQGGYVTSFEPDGMTYEKYFGLTENGSFDQIASEKVPLSKWVTHVPSYANTDLFVEVDAERRKAPTLGIGVGIAGALIASQALNILLKDVTPELKKRIIEAPKGKYMDTEDGVGIVRFRRLHFYKSLARAAFRTKLGLNNSVTL